MHAVEPLKLNKYVALNCQTHEALIFKLSSTREKPETGFSRKKALPALMHLPWSSSVFVFEHPLERVCTVVFTKAVCHFETQCYLQKALLLLTWKIYIWDFILRVCCVMQTWSVHSFSSFSALRVKVCGQLIAGCIALVSKYFQGFHHSELEHSSATKVFCYHRKKLINFYELKGTIVWVFLFFTQ